MLFPSKTGGVGGECKYTHTWVHTFGDTIERPIGRHRTTKANIRSHLYGGPQG
ncbi:hypothetical protein BDK88_1328 [Natrinema hispanicum]|uniref:Uncharacterized protein n=1 Tax=Natrinema hispanicum TaxID=392421 RepID=A0A482YAT8_9EURY|nr:hypothetical protein BDK88_1328 [Natrinema hispanicum]